MQDIYTSPSPPGIQLLRLSGKISSPSKGRAFFSNKAKHSLTTVVAAGVLPLGGQLNTKIMLRLLIMFSTTSSSSHPLDFYDFYKVFLITSVSADLQAAKSAKTYALSN